MTLATPPRLLPQDLRLGLSGYPAAMRDAAEAALRALGGAALDDPGLWAASGLTGDGFPFELSFTTADDDLRWTFDPAALRPLPGRRRAVLAALRRAGWRCEPGLWRLAQRGAGAASFGAWAGGRHGRAGTTALKLYLDWRDGPAARAAVAEMGLPRPAHLPALSVPMLGLGPGPDRREVYYRAEPPPEALANLLAPAGLEARAGELRGLIEESWGHRLRDRFPGGRIGISYARGAEGAVSVTLFLFARSLWGGDARIRERMLRLLDGAGRATRPYAVATRALVLRDRAETRHGIVALTPAGGQVVWGVGLRPAGRP